MQYTEVKFRYSFDAEYMQDIFLQGLADMGFESFTDESAYIQTEVLDEDALRSFAAEQGQEILSIELVPDQNWNEAWEAEHPMEELPMGVKIVPHCAFGAGHHETTGMMIEALMDRGEAGLRGKEVLDNGCGTGVLGIFAARMGAKVSALDIDDKSVCNTRENALLNGVSLHVEQGDTPLPGSYDLILSNIHRNILLAQMPLYSRFLKQGGELWISGFYEEDIKPLMEASEVAGLRWKETNKRGEWRMMKQGKPNK